MFLWRVTEAVQWPSDDEAEMEEGCSQSFQTELPSQHLQIDPRPILDWSPVQRQYEEHCDDAEEEYEQSMEQCDWNDETFQIKYHENGTTVTITNTGGGHDGDLLFRAYDPTKEVVPSFNATTYTFRGIEDEKPPMNTVILFIDAAVEDIQFNAFRRCPKMKICWMGDNVKSISYNAFLNCSALKTIRLSRNLEEIGEKAFGFCNALDALFIPSSVKEIEDEAFSGCRNIRILSLPPNMTIDQIGHGILDGCRKLRRVTRIPIYEYDIYQAMRDQYALFYNNDEVHQALIDYYHTIPPPLHQICLDANITNGKIYDCIHAHTTDHKYDCIHAHTTDHNGMTPLHILAVNPHTPPEAIEACFHFNIDAIFAKDHDDMTPIEYLWEYRNIDCLIPLMEALCMHSLAR